MRKIFSYFFFLSCVDIFSQIITKEEGNNTLIVFAVYTLTIFLLQFIFLFYVSEKYFKKKLHIFFLSFLIIFNIFSLKFNYYKFILSNYSVLLTKDITPHLIIDFIKKINFNQNNIHF